MKINVRGMLEGAGLSVANIGQGMLTSEVQKMRDDRMEQFRQKATDSANEVQLTRDEAGRTHDVTMQEDAQNFNLGVMEQNAAANAAAAERDARQAEIDRKQELEDDMALISYKGQTNPDSPKVYSPYERAEGTANAKANVERFDMLESRAMAAPKIEDSLQLLEELNGAYSTGATPELMAKLGRYVGAEEGAAFETMAAAAAPLVLAELNLAKGPQTDQDAKRIESVFANFGKSNEANTIAIDLARKTLRRDVDQYKSALSYRRENNGSLWGYEFPLDSRFSGDAPARPSDGASDKPISILQNFEDYEANNY